MSEQQRAEALEAAREFIEDFYRTEYWKYRGF
jgi:hypothetical protein